MRTLLLRCGLIVIILLLAIPSVAVTGGQDNSEVLGVFEGITPCSNVDRPAPQIPFDAECEMMIWRITFYQIPETNEPTIYQLHSTYGMPQQNTTGIAGGGIAIDLEGKWDIIRGIVTDPGAVIYVLNPDVPEDTISLMKVDDNLLHLASEDHDLMVGNGGWSYTLNRTDKVSPTNLPATDPALERDPLKNEPNGLLVWGVFIGRTPCAENVVEFIAFPSDEVCRRVKWELTLYQDIPTGAPTTYHFRGTTTTHSGTWTITRGTPAHPDALVYHLLPDNSDQALAFLRADDNNLFLLDDALNLMVGDAILSYTLNREGLGG